MTTPERQLWFAVILQAIEDYTADPTKSTTAIGQKTISYWKNNAAHWLFRSKRTDTGSLNRIFQDLDFPIGTLRAKILQTGGGK